MNRFLNTSMLIVGGLVVGLSLSAVPAQAQCLDESECDALRAELREFHKDVRPLVRRIRQLRMELHELAEDSPARPALVSELRAARGKLRRLRREEIRPVVREFRQGCKRC